MINHEIRLISIQSHTKMNLCDAMESCAHFRSVTLIAGVNTTPFLFIT